MSSSSPPIDVGERHSGSRDLSPGSLPPASLIVDEILARDIEECSSSEDEHVSRRRPSLLLTLNDAPFVFHPQGAVYGSNLPAVVPNSEPYPALTDRDIEESREAERSILRDNHILPPKHDHTLDGRWKRMYRHIFSTKVRDESGEPDYGYSPLATRKMVARALETTPLLIHVDDIGLPTPFTQHTFFEAAAAANILQTTWQREAKTLLQYSGPLIITFLLHYSVTIGSVLTVGRIGMVELGAVNLATMTATITCYIPMQGLATALDTLCAQAYGSGHKHLVGLQAQRMTYMLWLLIPFITVLWLFSEPILLALIPDVRTATLAAQYLRILSLGTPGVAAFESAKRFMQAQGLFRATTYVLAIGAPFSFFLNWLFVFQLGWHFAGAALAMAVTQNLLPILVVLYVRYIDGGECWNRLTWKAFTNWGPMFKLALPGMIMIEAQFSVLEILTLAAGQFGPEAMAAQSVLATITSTSFNIPFPLAIAASTRVANLIGARMTDAAKTSAKVAAVAGLIAGMFNLSMFMIFRYKLPFVFTSDQAVADIVSAVMPVVAAMQLFDAMAAISHGLLRGIGRQSIGGYMNLFSYYFVALPVALSTAFTLGWNLGGLWAGLTSGLFVVSAIEMMYLTHTDWDSAVTQAQDRLRSDNVHDDSHAK